MIRLFSCHSILLFIHGSITSDGGFLPTVAALLSGPGTPGTPGTPDWAYEKRRSVDCRSASVPAAGGGDSNGDLDRSIDSTSSGFNLYSPEQRGQFSKAVLTACQAETGDEQQLEKLRTLMTEVLSEVGCVRDEMATRTQASGDQHDSPPGEDLTEEDLTEEDLTVEDLTVEDLKMWAQCMLGQLATSNDVKSMGAGVVKINLRLATVMVAFEESRKATDAVVAELTTLVQKLLASGKEKDCIIATLAATLAAKASRFVALEAKNESRFVSLEAKNDSRFVLRGANNDSMQAAIAMLGKTVLDRLDCLCKNQVFRNLNDTVKINEEVDGEEVEAAAARFVQQTAAATTVQSAYRAYVARKHFAAEEQKFEKDKAASEKLWEKLGIRGTFMR